MHLKRFNYVNNKWVKSQKVVNFPYENFDPTSYLASVPQETILRHKELLENGGGHRGSGSYNHDCHDEIVEFDREMSMIDEGSDEVSISSIKSTIAKDNPDPTDESDGSADRDQRKECKTSECNSITPAIVGTHPVICASQDESSHEEAAVKSKSRTNVVSKGQRKRLVSSSLTKTPVIDGHFIDFHKHHLKPEQDSFDLKYQLYAAVVRYITVNI